MLYIMLQHRIHLGDGGLFSQQLADLWSQHAEQRLGDHRAAGRQHIFELLHCIAESFWVLLRYNHRQAQYIGAPHLEQWQGPLWCQ